MTQSIVSFSSIPILGAPAVCGLMQGVHSSSPLGAPPQDEIIQALVNDFDRVFVARPQGDASIERLITAKQFDAALMYLNDKRLCSSDMLSPEHVLSLLKDLHPSQGFECIDSFITAMTDRDASVKDEGDVNARYLSFHNALNELLVRIQSLLGAAGSNGNLKIPAKRIVDEVINFMYQHREEKIAGPCSKELADKFIKQFKQGTVKVANIRGTDDFVLVPNYSSLYELSPCLFKKLASSDNPLKSVIVVLEMSPCTAEVFWSEDYPLHPLLPEDLKDALVKEGNATQIQALQMALDDVRKIHETETQFGLEAYNRDLTHYNNMVKSFSSFMESLMQTLRGFLG